MERHTPCPLSRGDDSHLGYSSLERGKGCINSQHYWSECVTRAFLLFIFLLNIPSVICAQADRTPETNNLYKNLKLLVDSGKIMFGMANPTTISYVWRLNNHYDQSDCKDIVGSHPAFYESDFMWYRNNKLFKGWDIKAMKQAYKRGAVIGYCWHIHGRHSNSFRSKDRGGNLTADSVLVKNIVENNNRDTNSDLQWYLNQLDSVVIPVMVELDCPIVYRPFHEMNGHWFWWGSDNCTPDDYIKLYRLTVDYLQGKGLINLLFAWSPDKIADFRYYPGDDYVDILGLDVYEPGIADYSQKDSVIKNLILITEYAASHDKVAAITETGCRKTEDGQFRYPDLYPDFWTEYVLYPIIESEKARRIAWIMSWYAINWNEDYTHEMYIPYLGCKRPNIDKAIEDFIKFYNNKVTVFEDNLKDMYK